MRHLTFAAGCLAALALATGCGSDQAPEEPEAAQTSPTASVNPLEDPVLEGEAEEGARSAAQTYIEAVRTGDGQVGCFTLTEQAREELVGAAEDGADCAAAFGEALASPDTTARVDRVEMAEDGETATVHLTYTGEAGDASPSLTVANVGGAWLVDGVHPL